ncbi:type II secretion system F family protein [Candidatus Woesearchaeota archaeon]|nr:type II secretion system F family protein [Candidatus Woesearchaeota archaeon]
MIETINLPYLIIRKFPALRMEILKAHMKETPEQYVKKSITLAIYASVGLDVLVFFLFSKFNVDLILLLPILILLFIFSVLFMLQAPKGFIRKREREINKDVLFAGRYLLVKIQSGVPLFNALIDASRGYGVCAKYFKEIVDDINIGVPIEDALERARELNCSEKFKLILSELVTSLKTGADIVPSLTEVLTQITDEQILEIKAYNKKLNAIMMMYLIMATVMPSLGMTMFTVISGFVSFRMTPMFIFLVVFSLSLVQLFFLSIFKSIRPMVNL